MGTLHTHHAAHVLFSVFHLSVESNTNNSPAPQVVPTNAPGTSASTGPGGQQVGAGAPGGRPGGVPAHMSMNPARAAMMAQGLPGASTGARSVSRCILLQLLAYERSELTE